MKVIPGRWYFAVKCEKCGTAIPVLEDPSCGKVRLMGKGGAQVIIGCVKCAVGRAYPVSAVGSIQATRAHVVRATPKRKSPAPNVMRGVRRLV
jgi:RNase P subunit RPR2